MENETASAVPPPMNPPPYRRPRREWERVTPSRQTLQSRDTIRVDGPSPSQEILSRHDADLEDEHVADDPEAPTIVF